MFDIDTKCVQSGYDPKNGESRVVPLVQSTTYVYDTPEEMGDLFDLKKNGFFYARLGSPTLDALEKKIADLDGGVGALCCASGMAATTLAALNLCRAGDNFISTSTIYGGTYNLFCTTLPKYGITCKFVEPDASAEEIAALVDEKTKFLFCETIANPAMAVADFDKLSSVTKKFGIPLMVDNTLATPIICRPFEHGADIIVYSSTKYLDGHATSLGGIIVDSGKFPYLGNPRFPDFNTPDESYHGLVYAKDFGSMAFLVKARGQMMRDLGAQAAPFNAFLTVLGIDTLHLRMPRHSSNALALAKALEKNEAVEWVKYGGLESDPNYALTQKYFTDGMASGMVTFGIKGGREAAMAFQKALKLFRIVTHIADARSCVLHPASTTHRQLSDADLVKCGISSNLIRLSVGIESSADIIADVENALAASRNK